MAKTTNILDLNNRLEKVEKGNVAQNSYTSLKNKPKINGVTLTGNKSLADIGAAAAADLTTLAGDVGDVTNLTTTYKTDVVGAVNEVNSSLSTLIKYTDITITDTIELTAGVPKYLTYTSSIDSAKVFGVKILSVTGDSSLDGTVGAYVAANNFIHLLTTSNKSFTSITVRLFYLGN